MLNAGAREDSPWFVMNSSRGVPITQYFDQQLSIAGPPELFLPGLGRTDDGRNMMTGGDDEDYFWAWAAK